MRNKLSPISLVLDANAPSFFFSIPAHVERKIAARWKEWEPWVWLYLRQRGCAPAGSPELACLRRRHAEHLVSLMQAGVRMRLVRRHRLDDPRITDEVRAVLIRASRERRKKAWHARHDGLCDPVDWMAQLWGAGIRSCPLALEFPRTPPRNTGNVVPSQERPITIDLIRKEISQQFHLRELGDQDLQARSNKHVITFPRQLAMYLARQLTRATLPEIGRQFGGKHHTTVLHSINKIAEMRRSDEGLNRMITQLMDALQ